MLEQLIVLTNSKDFFSDWHLRMEALRYFPQTDSLKFVVQTVQDGDESKKARKFWEIACTDFVSERMITKYFIPNTYINILNEHPLLWNYEPTCYLKLKGKPANLAGLMGDLFLLHVEVCGNWLDFDFLFRAVYKFLPERGETTIEMPVRLSDRFKTVFERHAIAFSEAPGQPGDNGLSVLFIGNKDISPDAYNFYQHYVVAKSFAARVVTPGHSL